MNMKSFSKQSLLNSYPHGSSGDNRSDSQQFSQSISGHRGCIVEILIGRLLCHPPDPLSWERCHFTQFQSTTWPLVIEAKATSGHECWWGNTADCLNGRHNWASWVHSMNKHIFEFSWRAVTPCDIPTVWSGCPDSVLYKRGLATLDSFALYFTNAGQKSFVGEGVLPSCKIHRGCQKQSA